MLKENLVCLQHEMIHAHLMSTGREDLEPELNYHGPNFNAKMKEINQIGRVNLTVGSIL